jgi:hypothetical protein
VSRVSCSHQMKRALLILLRGEATATNVGAELTGRRSAYGPQTSAREGGRTLRALQRRKLAEVRFDGDVHWQWSLTPMGRVEAALVLKYWEMELIESAEGR